MASASRAPKIALPTATFEVYGGESTEELDALVEEVLLLGGKDLSKYRVTVEKVLPGPVMAEVIAIQIEQVLLNLLINARQAMKNGGKIRIEVRDGGPGLTEQDWEVAFEPAVLFSRYRGVRQVGSGVGLALVSKLANRLGATPAAGSAPEGGACFSVTFTPAPSQR